MRGDPFDQNVGCGRSPCASAPLTSSRSGLMGHLHCDPCAGDFSRWRSAFRSGLPTRAMRVPNAC
jgi:hypothetical protein